MQNKWNINNKDFESDKYNNMLKVNPWAGHREFIYDLISYINPDLIVELGTHYGCSFFAMTQAIKDFKLSTEIIGIDTWEGEEHAGIYSEEVLELVKSTIEKEYVNLNIKLMQMYFLEAVEKFNDNSIDILHIDGLHTYEATKEDFTNWLPKVKENGIVIFHDIANYTGYGSHKFWNEIKEKYIEYFEFDHSWGLGILFPKGSKKYDTLKNTGLIQWLNYYKYKSEYELYKLQKEDQEKMIDERDEYIKKLENFVEEYTIALNIQTTMIDERDKTIASQTTMIDERDLYIKNLEKIINETRNK